MRKGHSLPYFPGLVFYLFTDFYLIPFDLLDSLYLCLEISLSFFYFYLEFDCYFETFARFISLDYPPFKLSAIIFIASFFKSKRDFVFNVYALS